MPPKNHFTVKILQTEQPIFFFFYKFNKIVYGIYIMNTYQQTAKINWGFS